jgi:hypothetical protein
METTPRKTGEELRDGATNSGKSTPTKFSSELSPDEQDLVNMAIEKAEEYDPVLVLKWNHEWLHLLGNIGGKWKKEQILS